MDAYNLTASQTSTARKQEKKNDGRKRKESQRQTRRQRALVPPAQRASVNSPSRRVTTRKTTDLTLRRQKKSNTKSPPSRRTSSYLWSSTHWTRYPRPFQNPTREASESLTHRSESLRWAHLQLEKCLNKAMDPPPWLLDIVMRTESRESSTFDNVSDHVGERAVETHSETSDSEVDLTATHAHSQHTTNATSDPPPLTMTPYF